MIALYFLCVWTTDFSNSPLEIKFLQGIFNLLASCNNFDLLFLFILHSCNPQLGYKKSVLSTPVYASLTPWKFCSHWHHLKCCIAGFLHQCIYTLQHIPGDGFYLACIQSQFLKLLLLCKTCHMTRLDHGNSSWCILSTFSAYHAYICLSFLQAVLSVLYWLPEQVLVILMCARGIDYLCK